MKVVCFFTCKTPEGYTIPIYPEYYNTFEHAYNHFIYKILSGILGENIFKNTIELNENKSPILGGVM